VQAGKETLPSSNNRQNNRSPRSRCCPVGTVSTSLLVMLVCSQFLCEDVPKAALAWTYKKGEHLVTVEKEKSLLTNAKIA
jgi:hypothetical protein